MMADDLATPETGQGADDPDHEARFAPCDLPGEEVLTDRRLPGFPGPHHRRRDAGGR